MTEPPRSPEPKPHTTPRWVKVSGIIAIVLAIAVVIVLLAGGGPGGHGPGRHVPGDSNEAPPAVTRDGGHRSPPGSPDHGE